MESKLNPTDGHLIAGVRINDHQFLGRLKAPQLFQIAPDPRDSENRKKVEASKDLQDLQEIREEVQRLFAGQKAKNVAPYAEYIAEVHAGEVDGITPPIILYSEEKLAEGVDDIGREYVQVPYDKRLVAIDGETQLAARFEAANRAPDTKTEFVAIYICHGKDKQWARQCFHDLNVLGVRPNAALSIGMDARDPLTRVAREVERRVPFFRNRVNKARRQLGTHDADVVTITSLRGACITLAEGIGGVKYGTRPVPLPADQVDRALTAAIEWFTAVTDAIGPAMEDRENKLASAPAVLAAIGAMGHELVNIEEPLLREAKTSSLARKLKTVDWRRAKHWEGIAGKFTPKGAFSVGGSKETAYAVYEALNDETSAGFVAVRTQVAQAAE
ncbi:MAG TPA: DNA sulfur modification protein DndB [Stellaceae bacterium]|jgi:DNA sulfur modification protein DndB|nr:DNA sulfur modification protein DndB [Stellaceae bacterium]